MIIDIVTKRIIEYLIKNIFFVIYTLYIKMSNMYASIIEAHPVSMNRTTVNVAPQTGSTFASNSNDAIEFFIPSQGLIDPSSIYLQADVTIRSNAPDAAANVGTLALDNPGLAACFQRYSVFNNNSGVLYQLENVGEAVQLEIMSRGADYVVPAQQSMGYVDGFNEFTLTNATPPVLGINTTVTPATVKGVLDTSPTATAVASSLTSGLCTTDNKVRLSLPLSLLHGPLAPSGGKYIPACYASERGFAFRVVFTLANVKKALIGSFATNASITLSESNTWFQLDNVALVMDQVNLGTDNMRLIKGLADKGELVVHYDELNCKGFTGIDATGTDRNDIVPKYTASLKNSMLVFKPSVLSFLLPNTSWFGKCGVTGIQWKAGSKTMPSTPINCDKKFSGNAYLEVVKCFKSLYNANAPRLPYYNGKPGNAGEYGNFVLGINTSDISFSDASRDEVTVLSGLNTSSTSQIEVRYTRNTTAYNYSALHFMLSDNALEVSTGTSMSRDNQ
jgi:hypothetical protein